MKEKVNIVAKFLLSLFFTTIVSAQDGWIQQSSGSQCNLYSVYFFTENNCWAVGTCISGGLVLTTTDGGSQWVTSYSIPLFSIQFIDENYGWTVGGDYYGGQIKHTTNGGTNWITQFNLPNYGFSSVSFIDENVGFVSGGEISPYRRDAVFKTTNGGEYWFNTIPYSYSTEGHLNSVFFVNQNFGCAVGENGVIRRTTNGGTDWDIQTIADANFQAVFFVNENIGWVVGREPSGGIILKSSNGGINWIPISLSIVSDKFVDDVCFVDTSMGWIVGENGLIIKTTNGGYSWDLQNSNTDNFLHSIHFKDPDTGWAVGNDGTILHTTNGGLTFVEGINAAPTIFSLKQNFPNPFNPTTKIRFVIPNEVRNLKDFSSQAPRNDNSFITLKVYDVLGNEVSTLVNEEKPAGTYEVEFIVGQDSSPEISSGIYFYQLKAKSFVETKKMVLLR